MYDWKTKQLKYYDNDYEATHWRFDPLGYWIRFGYLSPIDQVTLLARLQYSLAKLEAQRPTGIHDGVNMFHRAKVREWLRLLRWRRTQERETIVCPICEGPCVTARHKARTKLVRGATTLNATDRRSRARRKAKEA